MPVLESNTGGSEPLVMPGADFQMMRGSSAPTSPGLDGTPAMARAAVGKRPVVGTPFSSKRSSMRERSTSTTCPLREVITAVFESCITRTPAAPPGIQSTSAMFSSAMGNGGATRGLPMVSTTMTP